MLTVYLSEEMEESFAEKKMFTLLNGRDWACAGTKGEAIKKGREKRSCLPGR